MSDLISQSELLVCGGRLTVSAATWEIKYFFPGPDRRYNGTFVTVPGVMIDQYIEAWLDNWAEYQRVVASLPKVSGFSKTCKLGMVIHIGNFVSGLCICLHHMPVCTQVHIDEIVASYSYAKKRALQIQNELHLLSGLPPKMTTAEQEISFIRFRNNSNIEFADVDPIVAHELKLAIGQVREKISRGSNGLQYHIRYWFGKDAASIFMAEIQKFGLNIYLEQATFTITWKNL
jgi:hypothetical protein